MRNSCLYTVVAELSYKFELNSSQIFEEHQTYMILCQFGDTTDASDVYDA